MTNLADLLNEPVDPIQAAKDEHRRAQAEQLKAERLRQVELMLEHVPDALREATKKAVVFKDGERQPHIHLPGHYCIRWWAGSDLFEPRNKVSTKDFAAALVAAEVPPAEKPKGAGVGKWLWRLFLVLCLLVGHVIGLMLAGCFQN